MPTATAKKPSFNTTRSAQTDHAAPDKSHTNGTRPDKGNLSEQETDAIEALNEKYKDIPFDDTLVVKYGDPGADILRQVAKDVKIVDSDIRGLVNKMSEIMYSAHGVGLAAPQVNRSIRLFIYDAGEGLRVLINPVISRKRGETFEPEEGCLSIPGLRGVVKRADEIMVRGLDGEGRPIRARMTGFESRIVQHEVDHLQGILFIDVADPATLHIVTEKEGEDGEEGNNTAPAE